MSVVAEDPLRRSELVHRRIGRREVMVVGKENNDFTLLGSSLTQAGEGVELISASWQQLSPRRSADGPLSVKSMVTRRRVSGDGTTLIHEHLQLADQNDVASQEALLKWHAQPGTESARPAIGDDPGSKAWTDALVGRLGANPEFAGSTATFDGTIALAIGEETSALRIYAGKIIASGHRALSAPTFTLEVAEWAWAELIGAERNEFIRRAARGDLRARGEIFQYLRVTKAVVLIIDAARELREVAAP